MCLQVRYLQIRYQLKVRAYVRPTTTREFYEAVQSAKVRAPLLVRERECG